MSYLFNGYKIIFLLSLLLFPSCKKEQTEEKAGNSDCEELDNRLTGRYHGSVTYYPWQSSQEGDLITFRAKSKLKCELSSSVDSNEIHFYNLFRFYDCEKHSLIDNNKIVITYLDGVGWAGAKVKGEGTFIDDKFHFEGFVLTTSGDRPIILDAVKIAQEEPPCY